MECFLEFLLSRFVIDTQGGCCFDVQILCSATALNMLVNLKIFLVGCIDFLHIGLCHLKIGIIWISLIFILFMLSYCYS